jgi:hypothetical protein
LNSSDLENSKPKVAQMMTIQKPNFESWTVEIKPAKQFLDSRDLHHHDLSPLYCLLHFDCIRKVKIINVIFTDFTSQGSINFAPQQNITNNIHINNGAGK